MIQNIVGEAKCYLTIVKYRLITTVISLFVASLLSIGLLNVSFDSDILNSLSPYSSSNKVNQQFVNDNFVVYSPRTEYINGYSLRSDEVLTLTAFKQLNTFQRGIEALKFTYNGVSYSLQDLCDRARGPESALGVFEAARLTPTQEFIGLPCNRYSPIDAFNEGNYDYYNGLVTSALSLIYFPYVDVSNISRSSFLPFSAIGLPNSFLDANGVATKPSLSNLTQDSQVVSAINTRLDVWAGIPLPKDLVLGSNSYNTEGNMLMSSKRLIMYFYNEHY